MKLDHDGRCIHYRVEGSGPHVTLVHGVGSALDSWDGVVERLREHFTCLRHDLRGHGDSDKPPGPYTLDHFVDEITALLDHLGVERTRLVGFSLGGLIAQAYALAHPERLEKVVILSAIAGRTEEERKTAAARVENLAGGRADLHIEAALERWFTPEFRAAHPEIIEQRVLRSRKTEPAAYAASYRLFAQSDLADDLHRITTPALVMTGEGDPGSNPRMARLMHERIAGSRLVILPRLRHNVLLEAPDVIAQHLEGFL